MSNLEIVIRRSRSFRAGLFFVGHSFVLLLSFSGTVYPEERRALFYHISLFSTERSRSVIKAEPV